MKTEKTAHPTTWTAVLLGYLALFAVVAIAPYFFPVSPAESISYVLHYSNRAAQVLFLIGVCLLSTRAPRPLPSSDPRDSKLTLRHLGIAAAVFVLYALIHTHMLSAAPSGDGVYMLNRTNLLLSGLTPYKDFEFIYGPLLLYPSAWFTTLLHTTPLHGFWLAWAASWLAGIAMLWLSANTIDLPLPRRPVFFLCLLLFSLQQLPLDATSDSLLRSMAAAFVLVVVWRTTRSATTWWALPLTAALAITFTFAISLEQGVGAACGIVFLGAMRWWKSRTTATALAAALLLPIVFGVYSATAHLGMLTSSTSFAHGGGAIPILLSPTIFLVLFVYVVAACSLHNAFHNNSQTSLTAVLVVAGAAMLPAALGRCDTLHITNATPAFLVGVAAILIAPSLRRWWLPTALIFVALAPALAIEKEDVLRVIHHQKADQVFARSAQLPCDRRYYAPMIESSELSFASPHCIDPGYYLSVVNAWSPAAIERKLQDMQSHRNDPLLLPDRPLDEIFVPVESLPISAQRFTLSLYIPHARNQPITLDLLRDFVAQNYIPMSVVHDTGLRIWLPREPLK